MVLKFQKGNGIEVSNVDNPNYTPSRSGILASSRSVSSDDDMEIKQQTVSHHQSENNQLFERNLRIDDANSHCMCLKKLNDYFDCILRRI